MENFVSQAKRVIELEISELQRLLERINTSFSEAVSVLRQTVDARGKIIVCGVGKSGTIARKISATLNSTGATSVVLSSQDALHGDLGMVNDGDCILLLSYSGETDEIINLLPHLKRLSVKLVAMTGETTSTLARHVDLVLDVNVQREACPLNLAPTSSSTVMLVMGDALAMVLLESRGFQAEDFAKLHPGGSLGRALLTRVSDIMRKADRLPLVPESATILHSLQAMTNARSGAVIITDPAGQLAGIFTQGDFVRAFQKQGNVASRRVSEFMSRTPISIREDRLAGELLQLLEQHSVDEVVVIDADRRPVGLVDTQDLSKVKLF